MKELQYKNRIKLNKLGNITDIEEVEYQNYKLSIKFKNEIYNGIYIKYTEEGNKLKRGNEITFLRIELLKRGRQIYIYSNLYEIEECENQLEENKIKVEKNCVLYDLNPSSLIQTIMIDSDINYKSDIFIFKKDKDSFILEPLTEDNEKYIIKKNSNNSEFNNFISQKNIETNSLIFIENYISEGKNIKFNNMTLFNLANLEYIDEYVKRKLIHNNNFIISDNKNYNQKKYYLNQQMNLKNKVNIVFLKIIDINEKYVIGIDYDFNIYNIYKDSEKLNEVDDVYKIILIKNFTIINEEPIVTLKLNEYSYVSFFENSFNNLNLNDLSVINFNFIDFISPQENNYYNEIRFENNNFSFKISKKSEYIILKQKFNFNYNYCPIMIGLISPNDKEIHCFQFLLYLGLLNKVNCLINYKGTYKYGY